MAYSLEVKTQILERMKKEKIAHIAGETGISLPTLYKWKKEQSNVQNYLQKEENLNSTLKEQEQSIEVVSEIVSEQPESETVENSKSKKVNTKDNKAKPKMTIEQSVSESLKEVINEIKKKYYVQMGLLSETRENQNRYIKKYDKLEAILECSKDNKRAQMELMLVLINEGYKENAKKLFPSEDYEFVDGIIQQYESKIIKPQEAIRCIDEYCI